MTEIVIILTTVPTTDIGDAMASTLVEERLAACVNVLPPMTSYYRWKGPVVRDTECQLVVKTTRDRIAAAEARIRELHVYELPELLIVAVDEGYEAYLDWVKMATRPDA